MISIRVPGLLPSKSLKRMKRNCRSLQKLIELRKSSMQKRVNTTQMRGLVRTDGTIIENKRKKSVRSQKKGKRIRCSKITTKWWQSKKRIRVQPLYSMLRVK